MALVNYVYDYYAGIVGSRRRNSLRDRELTWALVAYLHAWHESGLYVVSGACADSADEFAAQACKVLGIKLIEYPIDKKGIANKWEFTQRAYARNRQIAEKSNDLYCLVHPDRTGGTENTIKHAVEMGKNVYLVNELGELYLSEEGEYPKCGPEVRLLG